MDSIEITKYVIQITFYITTGAVAILSFVQAKKTIFSPMRNEIFKKQLESLENFQDLLGKIDSVESLKDRFGFDRIITYNAMKVYVVKYAPNENPDNAFRSFRISWNIEISKPESSIVKLFPALYEVKDAASVRLDLTNDYIEVQNLLLKLSTSNFVPMHLQVKLMKFQEEAQKILDTIHSELNKEAEGDKNEEEREMRNIEYSVSLLNNIDVNYSELFSSYNECNKSIREYLKSDNLFTGK